jgi:hypothetical protein
MTVSIFKAFDIFKFKILFDEFLDLRVIHPFSDFKCLEKDLSYLGHRK